MSAIASPPVVAVVGPTASGKSALAVALALELDGEVVNADAMALYRGMDIGTATPTRDERRGVPHHLLDVWDVTTTASVAEYQRLARAAVDDVRARGRTPVLVGGSGLYVSAVLDRLDFPGTDEAIRSRLEAELVASGPAAMHARLAAVDPAAAAAILPTNGRRVVRALEVVELTGQPFTATLPDGEPWYQPEVRVGLEVPREELDVRIAARVEQMWRDGLLDEVRALVPLGLREGRTAPRALGYQQALDELDGVLTADAARASTVEATRRFARRQQRWFARDRRVRWLPYDSPTLLADVVALVGASSSTA